MPYKIDLTQGLLMAKPVPYVPAADMGSTLHEPRFIILHYTSSGKNSVKWLTAQDNNYVSAHLHIDRAGEVTQLVPFSRIAYHAGVSAWKSLTSLNRYSIGIELVNWGPLRESGGRYYSWTNAEVPAHEVQEAQHKHVERAPSLAGHRYWHRYTEIQIAVARACVAEIARAYSIAEVLGHDDIAPGRKIDPGPLLDMESFRAVLTSKPQP